MADGWRESESERLWGLGSQLQTKIDRQGDLTSSGPLVLGGRANGSKGGSN
jgi:hypothetical protein